MLRFPTRPTSGRAAFEARVADDIAQVLQLAEAAAVASDADAAWKAVADAIDARKRWSTGVKEFYSAVQHRKCGYCERKLTDYGDVEHFRPKSAIFRLDTPGEERAHLNNIEGRTYRAYPESGCWNSGYWWLAYVWDNYLVACGRCNQQWKNALFPVRYSHRGRPKPGDETAKTPYLLDPFGDVDPAEHLAFTGIGGIAAFDGSRAGAETIAVTGLDRPSLVDSRFEKATRAESKLAELAEALEDNDEPAILGALRDLHRLGDARFVHAGMVRCMFVQATGWTWAQLEAEIGA